MNRHFSRQAMRQFASFLRLRQFILSMKATNTVDSPWWPTIWMKVSYTPLPKRMREPFGEQRVAALRAVVFYGGLEGRLGTEEDDERLRTRDGRVEEVALEHDVMAGHEGQEDDRVFAALALVDAHGVGEGELADLRALVVDGRLGEADGEVVGLELADVADVAVEDVLLVVVLRLHDLVPEAEGHDAVRVLGLRGTRRIERGLEAAVEAVDAAVLAMHGREHLDIAERRVALGGERARAELDDAVGGRRGVGELVEPEITGGGADRQTPLVDGVRVEDDVALLVLAEDLGEADARDDA